MMKTGCTGTERPKNGTGGLRRVVLALAVLLLTCVLTAGAVSAEDDNVAQIGATKYATLQWAVDNVTDSTETTTIILLRNAEGDGVKVQSGKKIIFDLNNFTYNITGDTVGSAGTETNGFQLLKGSNITFKNGKITSNKAKILIQNYCNLTLENVTLDGTNLAGSYPEYPYTLSNNCGNTVLEGNTTIIAAEDGVAFDVCYAPNAYPEGVSVTIASDTVVISGPVEYGIWDTSDPYRAEKAIFNVPYGYDVDLTVSSPEESGGYYWKATSDNQMVFTFKDDSPIKVLRDNAVVSADGSTVTLLRDTTLDEPILIETPITFDGNGKKITAEGNTLTVVAGITEPVTIKNVVATISTSTANPILDSPINIKSPVVMENNQFDITKFNNEDGDTVAVILEAGAEGSTLKGTQITMGSADNTGVQGIAVYGNKVTISGSTITTTALQDDDKSTGIYTAGVGDITITDNTFVSKAENGAGNRGIMVSNPTANAGQSITITDNTFDLAAGAGDTAGAVVSLRTQ